MHGSGIYLERRGEAAVPVGGAEALAALLVSLRDDPTAAGVTPGPELQPLLPRPPLEPEWLRATTLLEEEAACPGERLFARSIADEAGWWRPAQVAAAAAALRTLLVTDSRCGREAQGCDLLLAAMRSLAPDAQIRLTEG